MHQKETHCDICANRFTLILAGATADANHVHGNHIHHDCIGAENLRPPGASISATFVHQAIPGVFSQLQGPVFVLPWTNVATDIEQLYMIIDAIDICVSALGLLPGSKPACPQPRNDNRESGVDQRHKYHANYFSLLPLRR